MYILYIHTLEDHKFITYLNYSEPPTLINVYYYYTDDRECVIIFCVSLASSSSSRYQANMESSFGVVRPRQLGIVIKHTQQAIKAGNCERPNHWLLTFL